jgi:hypothetical protein
MDRDGGSARQAMVNELVARIDENFGRGAYGDQRMTEEIGTRFQVSPEQALAFYKASQPVKQLAARAGVK